MKKFILPLLLVAAVSLAGTVHAQIKTPAPSPSAKLEQQVGLIDVTVEYSRPGKKDREVFGGLVPFGEKWRTGANKNTTIEFSGDVKIQGAELKAGKYALFTIPNKESWTIYFYKNTENWGVPREWDEEQVALTVEAKPAELVATFETFLINFDHLRNGSAHLQLIWENTMVNIKVETDTDKAVLADIKNVMAGPSQNDYYAAARYFYDTDKDLNKAATWIAKANSNDPKFWMVRYEALIHAKLGNYDKAIEHAQKSKELAEKAGNQTYVRNNTQSIEEW
ncbi:MAG: DUF2911 domain-containing protein, partial [Bacteroidota bacterium]